MKQLILVFALFTSFLATHAQQDSTARKGASSKNFGLTCSAGYAWLRGNTSPFSPPNSTETGTVSATNAFLFSGGLCFNKEDLPLSVGIEATLAQTKLHYKGTTRNFYTANLIQFTVDVPIHYRYMLGSPKGTKRPYIAAGPRAIFVLPDFTSTLPSVNSVLLNGEIAFGFTRPTKKTRMAIEAFGSFGILNIVKGGSDYRDQAIKKLYRDFAGIRLFFT